MKPNNDIGSVEKRFIWFTKALYEFKVKYLHVYPKHWGVLCFIINEFCCEISVHVARVLSGMEQNNSNQTNLIKAFSNSVNFEKAMQKELHMEYG